MLNIIYWIEVGYKIAVIYDPLLTLRVNFLVPKKNLEIETSPYIQFLYGKESVQLADFHSIYVICSFSEWMLKINPIVVRF